MSTISIIIPTHNRNHILKRAVDFLAIGSRKPDEVIIVDDGSATNVEIASGLPFSVQVFRHEVNKGSAAARNVGLRLAKSDIVLLMDDDIFADHNFVQFHNQLHEKYSSPEFGVFGKVYFDPEIRRNAVMHFIEERGANRWMAKLEEGQRFDSGMITANVSMKREFVLKDPQLFQENFPFNRNEDTEFGLRMMKRGLDLRFFSSPSARHHSPLSFTDWISILSKSGRSKAYWINTQPDDTEMVLLFERFVSFFIQKESIDFWHKTFREEFVDILDEDWHVLNDAEKKFLLELLAPTPGIIEGKSIVEGWCEGDVLFLESSAKVIEAVLEQGKKAKAQKYYELAQKLPHPPALVFATVRALVNAGRPSDGLRVLSKLPDSRWKSFFEWYTVANAKNLNIDNSKWGTTGLNFLRVVDSYRAVDRAFRKRVIDILLRSGFTLSNPELVELMTAQEKMERGIHLHEGDLGSLFKLYQLIERQQNLQSSFSISRLDRVKNQAKKLLGSRRVKSIKSWLVEGSF